MPAERTYAAVRIDAGVYLQPSNDGRRRFAIVRNGSTWSCGEIAFVELQHAVLRANLVGDVDGALDAIRRAATRHGHKTKRDAIETALRTA